MSVRNLFSRFRMAPTRSDSRTRAKWRPRIESLEIRLNPAPYLLVSDGTGGATHANIFAYNAADGSFAGVFVGPSTDLGAPDLGMIVSPDGNDILVDGFGTSDVTRYHLDGSPDPAPGQTGAVFVAPHSGGLTGTEGIGYGADGNLYVCNDGGTTGSVQLFDGIAGTSIGTFISAGNGGMGRGNKLVWGPDGNLYVSVAGGDGSILRFDPNGNPLPSGSRTGARFTDPVPGYFANGFGFDANGNLIVSEDDPNYILVGPINRYDTNGDPLPADGQTGATFIPADDNGLQFVDDLAIDVNNVGDGNLYLTDETINAGNPTNRVQEYDVNTGAFIGTFVTTGSGGLGVPGGLLFFDDGTAPHPHGHLLHHTSADSSVAQASLVSPRILEGQAAASINVQSLGLSVGQQSHTVSLAQQTQTSQQQSTITPTALQHDAIDSVFAPASSVQGMTMDGLDLSPI